ncbi:MULTISPECIES: hypothetical protein [unclassified Streptomyces]|uniref:hypothetical protein n=1 Tax=unclassified Streptomyces TaxID=2593676 RepID=UPI002E27EBEA|nr:hypothetical protein [Streptomyces sp. NBC_00223]
MRSTFCCVICGVHYLPPENMVYPDTGATASPAHCANPGCTAAARDGQGGLSLAALETMALSAVRHREAVERRIGRTRPGRRARAGGV